MMISTYRGFGLANNPSPFYCFNLDRLDNRTANLQLEGRSEIEFWPLVKVSYSLPARIPVQSSLSLAAIGLKKKSCPPSLFFLTNSGMLILFYCWSPNVCTSLLSKLPVRFGEYSITLGNEPIFVFGRIRRYLTLHQLFYDWNIGCWPIQPV